MNNNPEWTATSTRIIPEWEIHERESLSKLRDEIAMRAMESIIENLNEFFPDKFTTAALAVTSYILADAMLKAREWK